MPDLAASQNPDGGWPFRTGTSCTEPTAYALLALVVASGSSSPAAKRAAEWLARTQRQDGGWSPRADVDQSTWVTALVLLLPDDLQFGKRENAVRWLTAASGRESNWVERARAALLEGRVRHPEGAGWPWFPGTAAWVTPTCFSLLAAEKVNRARPSVDLEDRCQQARTYLLTHTCRDGGWNHGSTKALGYDSDSYPETTGQALLALHGRGTDSIQKSVNSAQRQAQSCKSLEALSWLKLGLLAHGVRCPSGQAPKGHGSVTEEALDRLARAAEAGRNIFIG
jgi:squalene cyclase